MDRLLSGVAKFKREVYPEKAESFRKLANSQQPEVLFITCSDSRVDPSLITQAEPGELFICRNAGNMVPPYSDHTGGMTASIEYAVAVLGVEHIVVCGHSDCGAMKGALNPESVAKLHHVREWLSHARAAVEVVREQQGELNETHLDCVTRENIALQLQHLRAHPAVAARLASGRLQLHGWMYDIETGEVSSYDEATRSMRPLEAGASAGEVASV